MRNPGQGVRKINLNRARRLRNTTPVPRPAARRAYDFQADAVYLGAGRQRPATRRRPASEQPGYGTKSSSAGRAPGARRAGPSGQARRKKAGKGKLVLRVFAAILGVLVLGMAGLYWYVASMLSGGSISNNSDLNALQPPELTQDQMNILVLGLDYEEEGEVERSQEYPMTDMILYVQYDRSENSLRMLQIPRDCYIGAEYDEYTAGTGKINGVYAFGPNKDSRVQNLVDVLNDQLKLAVDGYVTIDMQSLQEMFNAFGGPEWALEVYVPVSMEYNGSRLEAGYHYLKGEELEFFLRQRKDVSATPRGDYDRLNNQRYFYSALFKYMKTMSVSEMMRLVPWALKYVNTSIDPLQCVALALAISKVPNENIAIGRLPVYDTQVRHNGQLCSEIAAPETADFLNQYFRPEEAPVDVSQLEVASLGLVGTGVVDPEMSHMAAEGMVAEGAGAADSTAQPATDTGESGLAPAA